MFESPTEMDIARIKAVTDAAYSVKDYPALREQMMRWAVTRPFEGCRVVDATPIYRNTLLKYQALVAGGAELAVGVSSAMPKDPNIVGLLEAAGFDMVTPETLPANTDIVLDCAGAFSSGCRRIGSVELTRSGVDVYHHSKQPVFVADGGRIKKIETMLGTGESFFRAMKQLHYNDWKGKRLVVFGSGKVGSGIIFYACRLGASVTVISQRGTVSDKVEQMAAKILYPDEDKEEAVRSVLEAYAVVTATGVRGAATSSLPAEAFVSSSAMLVNMGVEDEYGPKVPKERVLNRKRPLNFILEEPTHLRYIDATMALSNEGALYVLHHPEAKGLINPPETMEAEILNITRTHGRLGKEIDWI